MAFGMKGERLTLNDLRVPFPTLMVPRTLPAGAVNDLARFALEAHGDIRLRYTDEPTASVTFAHAVLVTWLGDPRETGSHE